MITNNSYIRSDYGIINKNIIAQTKLDEYNKESNKNFLATKEYVDSKTNNVKVNLCYTIDNPYVYEIKEENNQKYIVNFSGVDYDIDGKKLQSINISIKDNEYYIGRYIEKHYNNNNNEIINIDYFEYKLIKIQLINDQGIIIEENDINIGQEFYSKYDQNIYKFIMYYDENNIKKIIFTPINIYLNIKSNINNSNITIQEEINDLLIFNINNNMIYHNIIFDEFDILNDDITNYKKENEMIKTITENDTSTTFFYFDNLKPINNFYNCYLFLFKKILYNNDNDEDNTNLSKILIGNEKIINYYSYSGIPKITINNNNISIPNYNSDTFNDFSLSNDYKDLKKEDFYIVLEKYNEEDIIENINGENQTIHYIYYKGEIELNNNGNIEKNIIDIKYNNNNNLYYNNNSEFISLTTSGNLQFILINYDKKCVLNIEKKIENDIITYNINKIQDDYITETRFYKDLTLLINLNIDIQYDNINFENVKIIYEFNLLSSPNEQRVKVWENNNNYITILSLFNYIKGFT